MLFESAFATKDCGDASACVERNEDLEKLYQNGLFGAGGPKRPPVSSPARRAGAGDPGTLTLSRISHTSLKRERRKALPRRELLPFLRLRVRLV